MTATMAKKAGTAGGGLWAAAAVGALLLGTCSVSAFLGPLPIPLIVRTGRKPTRLKHVGAAAARTTLFSRTTRTIHVDDETMDAPSMATKESSPPSQLVATDNSTTSSYGQAVDGYTLVLFLCFFVTVLSALDRVAMSVALVPMTEEFALTDTIKGQISSVFSVGYGLCILPCGLMVAAASPRLIMAAGVALWSLATIGTPIAAGLILVSEGTAATASALVENVAPLLVVRAVMGGAESVVLPAIQRILANWVPPDKKSLAVASVLSGFQLGTVCAYLVSPLVIDHLGGWRAMFNLYGVVGILWLVPWLLFARDLPPMKVLEIEHASEDEEEIVLMNTLQDDDLSLVPEHVFTQDIVDNVRNGGEAYNISTRKEMIVEPELPSPSAFEEAVAVFKDAPWKELATSKAVWAMVSLFA